MIRYEQVLNAFRKIFCECGDCGHIFRLSETEFQTDSQVSSDWLSKIDAKIESLERKIEHAEEKFNAKKLFIIEKERKSVEREVYRKVNRLVPNFSSVRFNTRDVKVLGFPVKFISFDGKDEGWVKKLRLIDFYPETAKQEQILSSLENTIKQGNLEWKTLRINEEGRVEEE